MDQCVTVLCSQNGAPPRILPHVASIMVNVFHIICVRTNEFTRGRSIIIAVTHSPSVWRVWVSLCKHAEKSASAVARATPHDTAYRVIVVVRSLFKMRI